MTAQNIEEISQLTDNLYSFYRNARLSQFSERQAIALTAKWLEVMTGHSREAAST
jgi:hypothetical protein